MSGLGTADRTALLALGAPHTYRADEPLMGEGERTTFAVLLLRGWCTVWAATERGTIILGLRQSGEVVGDMAALDGRPRSASVSALGPVTGLVVPGDRFRVFLASRPHANALLIAQLTERLRHADVERRALASLTVLQRLSGRLVELAERTGQAEGDGRLTIRAPLAQHELAATVGATREAVAKALRLLRDQGLVRTGPGTLVVNDLEPLRLLAAGSDL
ncbi:Crp/Fnr family transcriptional regulator [Streptacidiphilus pinicola]|uniref:Crp/Fnr family transcriptional regulator n=1 Tax=Streptacidiphilus pinicola TaxID=2219663 RepID=A0A2X0J769_9ACTN|nr:Crp/Fnr family transcriptional regulator [Streptacidiphilus pinicola]RAG86106.1 Crp/Fnr family transcriptional regulator [Streptacidiphilus pinicola]